MSWSSATSPGRATPSTTASGRSSYTAIDDPLQGVRPGYVFVLLRLQRGVRGAGGRRAVPRGLRNVSRRNGAASIRATTRARRRGLCSFRRSRGSRPAIRCGPTRTNAIESLQRYAADRGRSGARPRPGVCRSVHADRAAVRRRAGHAVHDQRLPPQRGGRPRGGAAARSRAVRRRDGGSRRIRSSSSKLRAAVDRQVVGPPAGLPHAQRLVRLRRPPDVGHRDVSRAST